MSDKKTYDIDDIIKIAAEIGIQAGMDYIKKEKEKRRKSRHDRRLRNTKLLLKEYRKLKIHSRGAVYNSKQFNPIDVLDELDEFEYDDNLYIESIKQSKERTAIIIGHVKRMMKIYRYLCQKSNRPEEERRYQVLFKMYISQEESSAEKLAKEFNIAVRAIYYDIDKAIETLSTLIFGIDAIKIF